MKNQIVRILWIISYLGVVTQVSSAQRFEEIRPIQSTCKAVEKAIGGKHCGQSEETIALAKGRVKIAYSNKRCERFFGQKWQVPVGTVMIVEKYFTEPKKLEDIGVRIYEEEFNKTYTDVIGQIIYDKKTGDIGYSVIGGFLSQIVYYPSNADKAKYVCNITKKSK